MNKVHKIFFFFLFIIVISCKNSEKYSYKNEIIPSPLNLVIADGYLKSGKNLYIVLNDSSYHAEQLKLYIRNFLSTTYNTHSLPVKAKDAVILYLNIEGDDNPEAYHLRIDKKGIHISASDYPGLFWGFQTLRQIFPPEIETGLNPSDIKLPYLDIYDIPRFKYRGMHLDVCRHFFTVDEIKSYIDLLVLHKFNFFHWHLTEDQGWRIEIEEFPLLTEIAAQRKETVIKKNWGTYDGIAYGGYYSKEDVKEIVSYAEDRFITVIPEIEMPGHALAALTAYPELGCTGGPYEVATSWGVFDDVFCAGNEEVFIFLEKVIDEVIMLFPNSPYIHIGGDECPKTRWKKCPKCQERIRVEELKDEYELQSYFIQRMERYINSKDKRIIGWDEILEGGLAPNATVMSWRGEEGGIDAAKMGHDVIMTPNPICYFDHYQSQDVDNEPFAIGGFTNCNKIYNWNPIPEILSTKEAQYIIGVQANVWTEYIHTLQHIQYMVLPRMAVLSEVAWSQKQRENYSEFKDRLQTIMKRYDIIGYNYAKHEVDQNKL